MISKFAYFTDLTLIEVSLKRDKMMYELLSNLVNTVGGGTPSKAVQEYWGGDIPWASVKDVKDYFLSSTTDFITPEGVKNSNTNIIPAGTVIVATRMAVGRSCINTIPVAINQDLRALFCKDSLLPKYLLWFLCFSSKELEQYASGATVKGITLDVLKNLKVPLPPIAEQKRIAAILDKADAVRRKRREAIRLTEELLRSTFLEMFGDPITNPKGWKVQTLESVCSRVTVGYVGSMSSEYQESGIPWLRSLNVKRNYISFSELKYVGNDFHQKLRKSSLKPGDVVIVRTGKSGVASVIPESLPVANCSDLIVVTCNFELINNFYLSEVLNVILGDRDGGQDLTGAIQKHFNIKRAQKMNIPLPDTQLQENWRAIYQNHQVLLASLQNCVQESEDLFDSLLQRAFTGNL